MIKLNSSVRSYQSFKFFLLPGSSTSDESRRSDGLFSGRGRNAANVEMLRVRRKEDEEGDLHREQETFRRATAPVIICLVDNFISEINYSFVKRSAFLLFFFNV